MPDEVKRPDSPSAGDEAAAVPGATWLKELAEQLDAVIEEDPKKRSAGTLIVRALIRQALKGDVRAIRECMSLAQRHKASATPKAAEPRRRGRPSVKVDLDEVQRLARKGMRDISKIARCMGIPKQTLLGPKHGDAVKEAFETGRAFFELDALEEYAQDIAANRRNPLVIFRLKQIGWSDRIESLPPGTTALEAALANRTDAELADIIRTTLGQLKSSEGTVPPKAGPLKDPIARNEESSASPAEKRVH